MISQKSRYALRALFELAKRRHGGHIKVVDIAEAQAIPPRFLEIILGQLRQGGFVESRRGSEGGYQLVRPPSELTVGEVLEFLQGPFEPVDPAEEGGTPPLSEKFAFKLLWDELRNTVNAVLSATTFEKLIEIEMQQARGSALDFVI